MCINSPCAYRQSKSCAKRMHRQHKSCTYAAEILCVSSANRVRQQRKSSASAVQIVCICSANPSACAAHAVCIVCRNCVHGSTNCPLRQRKSSISAARIICLSSMNCLHMQAQIVCMSSTNCSTNHVLQRHLSSASAAHIVPIATQIVGMYSTDRRRVQHRSSACA